MAERGFLHCITRQGLALTLLALFSTSALAAEPVTIKLWSGKAPGETADLGPEQATKKVDPATNKEVITRLSVVSEPTITVYLPPKEVANGTAILIAPGGGYTHLAWDHEGEQIARWANMQGIAAAILKYRVPRRQGVAGDQPPPAALQDAQRAMSIVRSKAGEWGIDAKKVGMLGFSAGGHLTAWASTNFDKRSYDAVDETDKVNCRPDFAVVIYPGGAVEKGTIELKPQIRVTDQTPPTFIAMATDDKVNPDNCIALYMALKKAGVPVEMHLYAKGGHGFGIRPTAGPAATWNKRCEEWMVAMDLVSKPANPAK